MFSILPIVLAGYFFNVRIGLIVGMAVGFLNLLLNPYIVHPIQLLLDYPLAFGALGLGGILKKKGEYSIIGVLWISILARYFCAFLSVEGIMTTVLLFVPIIRHTLARLKENI